MNSLINPVQIYPIFEQNKHELTIQVEVNDILSRFEVGTGILGKGIVKEKLGIIEVGNRPGKDLGPVPEKWGWNGEAVLKGAI